MNSNQILTYINNNIDANGTNAITGTVLNSVLTEMVNQINDLVGAEGDLPNGYTNVISALGENNGIQIHSGTDNPNDTPPSSFNIGDFYSQTLGGSVSAFWQYNGINWCEVLTRTQHKLRHYRNVAETYKLDYELDDVVIYTGTNATHNISFPDASSSLGRIFTVVNTSDVTINLSGYYDLDLVEQGSLSPNVAITIISTGSVWVQINNI